MKTIPTCFDPPDRTPVQVRDARVLIIPDAHIPYHDSEALRISVAEGRRRKCNTILLNGDWGDFYSQSPHETNPKKRSLALELARQRQGLQWIREQFPKARIIHKAGNHELWWDRYLWSRAPDLVGLPTTTLQAQIDFPKSKIEFIDHLRAIKIGPLLVIHGHEYRFAISNPVNPARGLFLRAKVLAMCSHFHQPSKHTERDGNGKQITTWSTGCLCNLSPDYASRNNWAHGFAVVEIHKDEIDVENLSIINGRPVH